jgi:GT2 family glycosyltransferase
MLLELAGTATAIPNQTLSALSDPNNSSQNAPPELPPYHAHEIKPLQQGLEPTGETSYKLSVCIPTYNGARFLAGTISSVLGQTCKEFELIIVDDCSTDETEEIIKSFSDTRIKYFNNPGRLGLVGNWNRCLELTTSPYVYIFHQDDLMLPQNLEKKLKILEDNPSVGLVYSDALIINEQDKVKDRHWFFNTEPAEDFIMPGAKFFKMLISDFNLISCPGVMVRRSCYEHLGGFDSRLPFSADWEMWLRIALFHDVAYLAEPLIKYRYHESNESHNFKGLAELEQYYLCKTIVLEKHPEAIPNYQELKLGLAKEYTRRALDWAFHHYHHCQFDQARQAVAFALTLHATSMMETANDHWSNEFLNWLSETVKDLGKSIGNGSQTNFQPLNTQQIIAGLSGEDIAWQIPIRKLVKAMGFKVAKQPGLRWLYRYRDLGKKVMDG